MGDDFYTRYFEYCGETESPRQFHRWSITSCIGALLGRNVWVDMGNIGKIYPSNYIILMGSVGARKGTAIKVARRRLKAIHYNFFAANRTSKEAMFHDMSNQYVEHLGGEDADVEDMMLEDEEFVTQTFIAHDEFTNFTGVETREFALAFNAMWDGEDEYATRAKRSTSSFIPNPTISILSGSTPKNMADAYGPNAIHSGFYSRVLFIHGDPTGIKIAQPKAADKDIIEEVDQKLTDIGLLYGQLNFSPACIGLLTKIYNNAPKFDDRRFAGYENRRHTHLLKTLMVITATRNTTDVIEEDILKANTMMHLAEMRLPQALGEYGKARNSDIANVVMDILHASDKPVVSQEIWKAVSRDLSRKEELKDIILMLLSSERAVKVPLQDQVGVGYLPVIESESQWPTDLIDYGLVTDEEHPAPIKPRLVTAIAEGED